MALGPFVTFIPTTSPAAARRFYEDVLGLAFVQDDGFALIFQNEGVTLRVVRVEGLRPQPFTTLGFRVGDVRAAAKSLAAKGIVFERFPGMEQDELGVWFPTPGAQAVAWFKDPDGNLLSISS